MADDQAAEIDRLRLDLARVTAERDDYQRRRIRLGDLLNYAQDRWQACMAERDALREQLASLTAERDRWKAAYAEEYSRRPAVQP